MEGTGKEPVKIKGRKRRFVRRVITAVILLIFLLFGLLMLSQYLINQSWGTEKLANQLSKSLNTEVKIGSLKLNIFKGLEATDVLIRDHRQDTLIYAHSLQTDLRGAIKTALKRKLVLNDITIDGGQFNMVWYQGDDRRNVSKTFNPVVSMDSVKVKGDFQLNLGLVSLHDFEFRNHDYNRGSEEFYHIGHGEVEINLLDIKEDSVKLGTVALDSSDIRIHIFVPEGSDSLEVAEQTTNSDTTIHRKPFHLDAEVITFTNGTFQIDNYYRTPEWNQNYNRVDYDHMFLKNVEIDIRDFVMHNMAFTGQDLFLSLENDAGFTLEHLKVDDAKVDSTQMVLNGVDLQTPTSSLGDTVVFKFNCFESWRDFNNQIFIEANISESQISFRDIMTFAPNLYDNTFFINSENQILEVEGQLFGRINSLKGRNLVMKAGEDISFRGDVSTRDLTVKDQEILGLDIDQLRFDILSLENIIPNLDLPETFEKLGEIRFKGRFDGYFLDFVTYGNLSSNLGKAELDMRLDLKPGKNDAKYSGKIKLIDFDLQNWMENPDFGLLSMEMQVKEGRGLVLENANATVDGVINRLDFRGYSYENLDVDGRLTKNLFDGDLIADSEDAKFTFNGRIANLDSIPDYNFHAEVDHLRLNALRLTEKVLDFGGTTDISLTGLNWDELIGNAQLKDFWVVYDNQDSLILDDITIEQLNNPSGRNLTLNASFGMVDIDGVYDIPKLHNDLINIVGENHPRLAELIGIDSMVTPMDDKKDYRIQVDLKESFILLDYFTSQNYRLGKSYLDAYVNTVNQSIKYQSAIESIGLGNWDVYGADISLVNEGSLLVYNVNAKQVTIKEKPWFDSIQHVANLQGDSGTFKLAYVDPQNIFEKVDLDATMVPDSRQVLIGFKPSSIWFGRDKWSFVPNNSLLIKKGGLIFDNFRLQTDSAYITLDDINEGQGIQAVMEDFSANILDSLTKLKAFDFKGYFDANLSIQNLFKFEGIDFSLHQDSTVINNKRRGGLTIDVKGGSIKEGLDVSVNLSDVNSSLDAEGRFEKASNEDPANYKFDIAANNFPLEILEDIITSGISGTDGSVTGKLKLEGQDNQFKINGKLNVPSGQTKVDYLGVTYYFENQNIEFKDDFLDFNNAVFTDSLGHKASITGGLRHSSFKDWYLDLSITADQLIGLNTTKEDNPDYYGFAVGQVDIDFYGSVERPYIDVVATTGPGSQLVIPISYGSSDIQTGFVEFVKRDTLRTDTIRQQGATLTGLELDMKLTVTEDAKTSIIFDEQAGDVLEGYGRGNLNVQVRRTGELSVFGDYEIEEGDYLFTLLNFVNKPFIVKRGGTIRWTGDPIDAQINLEAEYKGLTAAPYPLIQEYLADQNLQSDARRPTRVDLTMGLSGSLLSPLITFEIELPNLVGELKTYAENKLQALRNDQDDLNQQVFGLVVFGSFLPSADQQPGLVTNLGASTINTLSEFLSNQLSGIFSTFLNDIVDDVDFISGIDVDLSYIQQYDYQDIGGTGPTNFSDGEYQFRLKNRLWNDRWVITLGGDYGAQSVVTSDPYFNPEGVLEWNTPVKGLKLRVYYRAEQNFQGQSQKIGGGIRFRKEFDNILDFKKALKEVDSDS